MLVNLNSEMQSGIKNMLFYIHVTNSTKGGFLLMTIICSRSTEENLFYYTIIHYINFSIYLIHFGVIPRISDFFVQKN